MITGAGRGIGLAIAHAFAREGAKLAIISRNPPSSAAAAPAINPTHPAPTPCPHPVSPSPPRIILWVQVSSIFDIFQICFQVFSSNEEIVCYVRLVSQTYSHP